ncbi:MAG: rhodanese-like domain-containing protein [Bacteroidetes bacterium]|nr:rhodanese-like domain-containing protein [Bacteroidota bacterium]
MIDTLKQMLGIGPTIDFAELKNQGAQIIDVRSPGEYAQGHIHGSINIPLQNLPKQLSKINKDKPVITCCASGMRSATAKGIFQSHGFAQVHNGGGWQGLKSKLEK